MNKTDQEPPTETFSYVASKRIGICDKCKQEIYELATFEDKRFSTKPEGREWLRNYVKKKLQDSGVIPEDALDSLTNSIFHRALRHGTHKQPNSYIPNGKGGLKIVPGTFACINEADFEIYWAIKCPPPPISRTRFSLKAFIKDKQP